MSETYEKIQLERYDDYTYLRSCGLVVKQKTPESRTCYVIAEQEDMAKRFLKSRRDAEELRNIRRDKQKTIDRNKIFEEL